MRILLAEDERSISDGISQAFRQEGYIIDCVYDGASALQAIELETFDLVILDLGLPRVDGLEVLKSIRQNKNPVSVLVLTARDSIEDKVRGLDLGADDYLAKPFDLKELSARVRSLVRRKQDVASHLMTCGDLELNSDACVVKRSGELVSTTRKEFLILSELLLNQGRVLSKDQLVQLTYGWGDALDSNAIEVHIHNLRKKLGKTLIKTVRGIGYIIESQS